MLLRLVAGFLQVAAAVAVAARWRAHHPVVGANGDLAAMFVHGVAHYLYFLFATLWGWLSLWLFVEGLLRVLAGAMQMEMGTAPVALGRALWRLRPRPELPADLVRRDGDKVIIESAHDYDWHALTTVEFEGAHYAVTREAGSPTRAHRYRLAPIGDAHVVRTVTRYPVATSAPDESSRTDRPPRR
jgi:hypothetical protein